MALVHVVGEVKVHLSVTVRLVALIVSYVGIAVAVGVFSKPLLYVVLPVAFICLAISCEEYPDTMFLVILDLTFVVAASVLIDSSV